MKIIRIGLISIFLSCGLFISSNLLAVSEYSEPGQPEPSVEIRKVLDDFDKLKKSKDHQGALAAAESALSLSQEMHDPVGLALSHAARAKAFQSLDRIAEAIGAWRKAAPAWEQVGDGPGRIESLAQAGLLLAETNSEESDQLLNRALALTRAEEARPIAAAKKIFWAGYESIWDRRQVPLDVKSDLLEAALQIYETLTPDSKRVASTLYWLSSIDKQRDDRKSSRERLLRAKELLETHVPDDSRLADIYADLASLAKFYGDLAQAREYISLAIPIVEKRRPDSLQVAAKINNRGIYSLMANDLTLAREDFQRTLEIISKQNPDDPDVQRILPGTLMNLGAISSAEGDLVAAEDYYQQALAIFEETGSINAATALSNLGAIAEERGVLSFARQCSERAFEMLEEKYGSDNPRIVGPLRDLGSFALKDGRINSAEKYYRRALAIAEQASPDSSAVGTALAGLGRVEKRRGEFVAAESYFARAVEIYKNARPNGVPGMLDELALVALARHDLTMAENYLDRSLAISEEAQGSDSPTLGKTLKILATVLAMKGETGEALKVALRTERIGYEQLYQSVRYLSEREALQFATARLSALDLVLTLVAEHPEPASVRPVWSALIRSRGTVLDEMAARHHSVLTHPEAGIVRQVEELVSARERLARLFVRGPDEDNPERHRKLLERARKRKEDAERALAETSAAFRLEQERGRAGIDELASKLARSDVLVAFARYDRQPLRLNEETGGPLPQPVPSYLALVLNGRDGKVVRIPLGDALPIDSLVARLREHMARTAQSSERSPKRMEAVYRDLAGELKRMVWDPLTKHMTRAKRVFVVPDGALNFVSLAALPVGESSYLVERGPVLHYLSAERDLLIVAENDDQVGLQRDEGFERGLIFRPALPLGLRFGWVIAPLTHADDAISRAESEGRLCNARRECNDPLRCGIFRVDKMG